MVHMLGTNAHRQNTIYSKMPQILAELNEIVGEETLKELTTTNPMLVLGNKRIEIKEPYKIDLTLTEKLKMLKGESIINIVKEFIQR